MEQYTLNPIGKVRSENGDYWLEIDEPYRQALVGLEGFGHVASLWWFSELDGPEARQTLQYPSPYVDAPEAMGVFATRGPVRPNPIALSVCQVLGVDVEAGRISVPWTDAADGSPLLDIKPYTPSADRVESPVVPEWCASWPMSLESSEGFDWESVFTF